MFIFSCLIWSVIMCLKKYDKIITLIKCYLFLLHITNLDGFTSKVTFIKL